MKAQQVRHAQRVRCILYLIPCMTCITRGPCCTCVSQQRVHQSRRMEVFQGSVIGNLQCLDSNLEIRVATSRILLCKQPLACAHFMWYEKFQVFESTCTVTNVIGEVWSLGSCEAFLGWGFKGLELFCTVCMSTMVVLPCMTDLQQCTLDLRLDQELKHLTFQGSLWPELLFALMPPPPGVLVGPLQLVGDSVASFLLH